MGKCINCKCFMNTEMCKNQSKNVKKCDCYKKTNRHITKIENGYIESERTYEEKEEKRKDKIEKDK